MYQPETYGIALSFMVFSMLCWGSWANTMKLCPGYRFQLFYWDYVVGLLLGAVFGGALPWGTRARRPGHSWRPAHAHSTQILGTGSVGRSSILRTCCWWRRSILPGWRSHFLVGIGLALIVGAVSSYVLSPNGNPLLLFGGMALVTAAIVFDAVAYRLRETEQLG